jgi:hypothetical protein
MELLVLNYKETKNKKNKLNYYRFIGKRYFYEKINSNKKKRERERERHLQTFLLTYVLPVLKIKLAYTSNDKHLNENTEDAFIIEDNNNEIVEKISQYIEYKKFENV